MINIPKYFMQCPSHTADTTETMNLGKPLEAEGRLGVQLVARSSLTDHLEAK